MPGNVTSLGSDVHSVVHGGYWSSGETEGFYRAVVTTAGFEHVSHSLFLQWVRINLEQGTYEVAATVPIKEIYAEQAQGHLERVAPNRIHLMESNPFTRLGAARGAMWCIGREPERRRWTDLAHHRAESASPTRQGRLFALAELRYAYLVVGQTTATSMPCQQTRKAGQMGTIGRDAL